MMNTKGQQSVPPVSQALLAKFFHYAFTQQIRISLAGLGKFDDSFGEDFVSEIAPVCKSKSYASHFESDARNAPGLRVELDVAV
jgi:hypothetical protein